MKYPVHEAIVDTIGIRGLLRALGFTGAPAISFEHSLNKVMMAAGHAARQKY